MDTISRAKHAQTLLNDPLITEFFDEYKRHLFDSWTMTKDRDARDELYRLQLTADAFRLHLTSYIDSGKIQLKREEQGNA